MNEMIFPLYRITSMAALGALLCATLLSSGCATTHPKLMDQFDADGNRVGFKRYEPQPQRDFRHHWTRAAMKPPKEKMWKKKDSAQALIVDLWGPPDWVRKPFRSKENERVQEWLYLDAHHLFQFIGDDLAYEGPMTDLEEILLQRGYPDRVMMERIETGSIRHVFVYHKVFSPMLDQFTFVDGQIVQSGEGM